MIDMHCHLLYKVDDGAKTIEESVEMLKKASSQGVDTIILTPHYRHGMFAYPHDKIEEHFMKLVPYARELGIRLFAGCEYHVNSDIVKAFDTGKCLTLAGSRYVLTEYEYQSEFSYIHKMTQELILHGYIPVIAHVERYGCIVADPDCVDELREMGAMIQVNADAVLGLDGRLAKKFCKRLLKNELVDIIASDSHGIENRACHMKECFDYISKKYDVDYAVELLEKNPARIISDK